MSGITSMRKFHILVQVFIFIWDIYCHSFFSYGINYWHIVFVLVYWFGGIIMLPILSTLYVAFMDSQWLSYGVCYLLNLVADWDCTLTFTATFVFPELSSRIFLATPSNTSPNAPLPRNLVNISWSRLKWGRAAISLSVGIILQKIMVSLLIHIKHVVFSFMEMFVLFLLKHNNLLAYIHVYFSISECFSKLIWFNLLFKVQSYIFLHSSVW